MSDQQIACSECGDTFLFTDAEQTFYREKGLAAPPKRCKACRQARKAASGGDRGGGRSNGPPRHSGGASEYRSPMNLGGNSWAPRGGAPQRGGGGGPPQRGAGGAGRGAPRGGQGGFQARGDARSGSRAPNGGSHDSRGGGNNGYQGGNSGPRRTDARGPNDYRSPAFPDQRRDGAPHAGRAPNANAPNTNAPNARPPRDPAAPRPERPKFDITCAECNVAAQVPFKPIEGRQVFCQECYRARRGIARPETEALDVVPDAEGGIVE